MSVLSTPTPAATTNYAESVMYQNSLAEYLSFINHQVICQEELLECHLKVNAMLKVLLESNLPNHSHSTMHHYLWGISDIINQAKSLNESMLAVLMKIVSLMEPSNGSSSSNTGIH